MLSSEQRHYKRFRQCPLCRALLIPPVWTARLLHPDGRPLSWLQRQSLPTHPESIVECSRCRGRWHVYAKPDMAPQPKARSAATGVAGTVIPQRSRPERTRRRATKGSGAIHSFEVIETHRTEEPMGFEERNIDNARSSTTVTRSLKASKEWTRSYSIDLDNTKLGRAGLSLSLSLSLSKC